MNLCRFRGFSIDSDLKGLTLSDGLKVKITNPDRIEVSLHFYSNQLSTALRRCHKNVLLNHSELITILSLNCKYLSVVLFHQDIMNKSAYFIHSSNS